MSRYFCMRSHYFLMQVVTELLREMNADVKGCARVANFQNVFQTGNI